ncbi:MAG TPA: DUF58 domain-containing protein [Anaerolineales bacterium]|nr:DUF58 domain-containing protein [Anaerolineales bacterium]
MKTSIRLNAKIFPVIGALALVMQIIEPSRVWVILLIGVGGFWLICRWWARGLVRSLQFEREMRFGWAQVGDRLEERFTLTNQFILPAAWVTLQDYSTLPDHHASVATGVDGSSTAQWRVLTQCTRRGVYTLGGTTLETGDPFGVYTITFEDPTSSTLAVMPPVLSLPAFQISSSGWAGEGKPNRHSLQETINISHPREMMPDDPMRLIHWKTTARHSTSQNGALGRDKFFVRQFEGSPAGDWWLLLDLDKGSQLGTGWDSTEEHAVILASSLAAQGLNDDHSVGLSINGNNAEWLVPRRNEYQLRSLLKALAVASPSEMQLKDFLQRAGQSLSNHCSLLIVTANADVEWTQSLLPLMWRGIMPTVFLFDPLSFGGSADTKVISEIFQSMNVPCHVIPREMFDKPQARPGHEGEWEWRISATGKAVAVRAAQEDWRGLQ